jgi:hypothetical protein
LAIRKLACCPLWQGSRATIDVTAESPPARLAIAESLSASADLQCGDFGRLR